MLYVIVRIVCLWISHTRPNRQSSFSRVMKNADERDRECEEKRQNGDSQLSPVKSKLDEEQVKRDGDSLNEIKRRVEALRTSGKLERMLHRIGVNINGHFEESRKHSW